MNKYVRSFVVSIGLSAMFGSSVTVAQEPAKVVANVPFAFHAKNINLPAGKYVVKAVSYNGVLQIADANTGHSVMIMTRGRDSGATDSPRLTFQRYGNEYFLSKIWLPGQQDGYAL